MMSFELGSPLRIGAAKGLQTKAIVRFTGMRTAAEEQSVSTQLESCHALVLNADYRPLSYFPLSLWPWQDAVKAAFLERVNIVSEYDLAVHSPSCEIRLPSVIALKQYVPLTRRPAFPRLPCPRSS